MVDFHPIEHVGERLKRLMRSHEPPLSVEEMAAACDVTVQAVYKWFNGGKIARKHLPTLADKLGIPMDALFLDEGFAAGELIRTFHPEDPTGEEEVRVPESRVRFSGGPGHFVAAYEVDEDREPATYRLSWFQKERINPRRVKRFRVVGRSMEPMLFPDDSILVNLDETAVREGLVYVFRHGDEHKVKKLIPRADGSLVLRSINRDEYPDDIIPADQVADQITIIGRVRDKSGRGGL